MVCAQYQDLATDAPGWLWELAIVGDAVAAAIMGFDPMNDIKYIRMATEQGLGTGILDEIEIIGEDIKRFNYHFQVGNNIASLAGNFIWFGPLKWAQKMFFRTSLVNIFVAASDVYHDKVWWNLKGKKVFDKWKYESPWGNLFEQY